MDEVNQRFQHLSIQIFDSLDNQSVLKCLEVNSSWCDFLEKQKFLQIRMIHSYIESHFHEVGKAWKSVFKTLSSENIIHLGNAVKNVYEKESLPLLRKAIRVNDPVRKRKHIQLAIGGKT